MMYCQEPRAGGFQIFGGDGRSIYPMELDPKLMAPRESFLPNWLVLRLLFQNG